MTHQTSKSTKIKLFTVEELIQENLQEFHKIFDEQNFWQGENEYTKNAPIGNLEDWIAQAIRNAYFTGEEKGMTNPKKLKRLKNK